MHQAGAATDQWKVFQADDALTHLIDDRWKNFDHMLGVAAAEGNEELIYIVFEQVVAQWNQHRDPVDAIRLVRPAVLSYMQSQQHREGTLPAAALEEAVLYEARAVAMPGGSVKLLPVLEKTRRASAVESSK
jgi:hypothetical protein